MTTSDSHSIPETSLDDVMTRAGSTTATALFAYLWGYPLVLMHRTKRLLTSPGRPHASAVNTFDHRTALATAADREIVKPNNDTLYSLAWLDLSRCPVVLDVPDMSDRYYSIALLDAYTNNFAYMGSRTTGRGPGRFVITGPSSRQESEEPTFDSPTDTVWVIGRTLVDGPEDLGAVTRLVSRYRLTPLAPGDPPPAVPAEPATSPQSLGSPGIVFFDELCRALEQDPPPSSERPLLERFAEVGIGAGRRPSDELTDPVVRAAVATAVTLGDDLLSVQRDHDLGWRYSLDLGDYGTNYLLRAQIARHGLGALTADEAIYATTELDGAGDPLTGERRYRLRFRADQLPPVEAFWSLTMYDTEGFYVENAADRYSLGDRTPGLVFGPDGSLDLIIARDEPTDPTERANWLPAPSGEFQLCLRCYVPQEPLRSGQYVVPPVERLGNRPGDRTSGGT